MPVANAAAAAGSCLMRRPPRPARPAARQAKSRRAAAARGGLGTLVALVLTRQKAGGARSTVANAAQQRQAASSGRARRERHAAQAAWRKQMQAPLPASRRNAQPSGNAAAQLNAAAARSLTHVCGARAGVQKRVQRTQSEYVVRSVLLCAFATSATRSARLPCALRDGPWLRTTRRWRRWRAVTWQRWRR